MCPLAGENYQDDSIRRTSDNTSKSWAEWQRHWRYDPKLGREREYSDAELSVLERQPRADMPHPIVGLEAERLERQETLAKIAAQNERARQAKLIADVAAKQEAARKKLAAADFALDSFYSVNGASEDEITRCNNKCASEGMFGNLNAHACALTELRARNI